MMARAMGNSNEEGKGKGKGMARAGRGLVTATMVAGNKEGN
jgi:hypothetical protein